MKPKAAEKNVEGPGDDFPLDVVAFAEIDDALEVGAGEIETSGDEDVGREAQEGVFEFVEGAETFDRGWSRVT